jgi:hypothetical protein
MDSGSTPLAEWWGWPCAGAVAAADRVLSTMTHMKRLPKARISPGRAVPGEIRAPLASMIHAEADMGWRGQAGRLWAALAGTALIAARSRPPRSHPTE